MKDKDELKEFLSLPRKIVIITHVRPDGDAMGSSLALYHFFLKKGHDPVLIFPTECPYFYKWFPGFNNIFYYQKNKDFAWQKIDKSEIIFTVDFNQIKRMNDLGKLISENKALKVLIDHHPDPEPYYDFSFHDANASSAAEKVFDFIEFIDAEFLMNTDIATCLYAGIVSDSGSFKFSSVKPETLIKAAKLMKSGINHNLIQRRLYDNFTENRLRFWGYCVNEKLEILNEFKTAIVLLRKEDLKKFNSRLADTENLLNFILGLEDTMVGILIVELPDLVKLSFRSKGSFPVNILAEKYFNGGGHLNAAGGQTNISLDETINLLKEKLAEFKIYSDQYEK